MPKQKPKKSNTRPPYRRRVLGTADAASLGRLHLTPEIIEAAYGFLRETPPFRKWRLPEADQISFRVTLSTSEYGFARISRNGHPYELGVSCRLVRTTSLLIETLAHEICHLRADMMGSRSEHGRLWRRAAESVCRYHGFDMSRF